MGDLRFRIGPTPNPNSVRVALTEPLFDAPRTFASAEQAAADPLAKRLFAVEGVVQVFMMNDFISVNKSPSSEWSDVEPKIAKVLTEHFADA